MRIFYQYSTIKTLEPISGDRINEINLLRLLSQFADVYYAGQLFQPDKPGYGLKEYSGSIKIVPADWSIIRANPKVFRQCTGKRIWICTPFYETGFREANFIGCMSRTWANFLKQGKKLGVLNPEGVKWPNAIPFFQSVDPAFKPLKDSAKTLDIRRKMGGKFVIGCFGRIVKSNYPQLLINSIPFIKKYVPGLRIIFGITGGNHEIKETEVIKLVKFSHKDMPYAINACDCIVVSQRGPEWEFCGNLKMLEPVACGIPVICQKANARQELLGKNYELFLSSGSMADWENRKHITDLVDLIKKLQFRGLKTKISNELLNRAKFYSVEKSIERLKKILK